MNFINKFMLLASVNMVLVGLASANPASWPYVGNDFSNSGTQPEEKLIDSNTVSNLRQSWLFNSGKGNPVLSQPTLVDGILYCADYSGTIYAQEARTGVLLWKQQFPTHFSTSPTLDDDKVYISTDTIYCLDRKSGQLLWSQALYKPGFYTYEYTGDCLIADSYLIVGVASHEPDLQAPHVMKNTGRIMAFNKKDGAPKWTLFLTNDQFSQNPEFGPGAGVWSSGAVDTKRGLLYIGTANAYRAPASPYTNSLLAINYKNGKIKWSYAFEHNDVWSNKDPKEPKIHNHDVSLHPNLFTVKTPEGKLDLVGVGCKNGHYKIFNRDQKNPDLVLPLADIQLDQPSVFGALQGAAVVNEGILYVASNGYRVSQTDPRDSLDFAGYDLDADTLSNLSKNATVKVWAFDIVKLLAHGDTIGRIPDDALLWANESQGFVFTGPITYSNGVVFQTSAVKGYARALDARTGVEKWRASFGAVSGGVTIADGMIFIPLGLKGTTFQGGIAAYKLP